jgi:hypothetical protein
MLWKVTKEKTLDFCLKIQKSSQKEKKNTFQNTNTKANLMRNAKQRVSDDLASRAQQLAFARSNAVTSDINNATNNSMVRAQAADRDMMKSVVMSNTNLSRRNQIMTKNAGGRVIVETPNPNAQSFDKRTEADRLGVKASVQSQMQNNRRKVQASNFNGESLSTSERIALEHGPIPQRNMTFAPNNQDQREFQPAALTQNIAQQVRNERQLSRIIREKSRNM